MSKRNLNKLIELMTEKVITQTIQNNGTNKKRTFNFSHLKDIEDLNELVWYAKSTLPHLSAKEYDGGSTRYVFHFGTGKVLKVAKNEYGIEQNQGEIFASRKFPDLVVKTYDNDPEYKWITSEAVRQVTRKEFEEFTGIKDFNQFSDFCMYAVISELDEYSEYSVLLKLPFIQKILDYYNKGLDIADMGQLIHWGKNSSGELRYLDPGLSDPGFG
jgi:hypothetical protein